MSNLHDLAHSIRSTALSACTTSRNHVDSVLFAQLRMIVQLADQVISELASTSRGNLEPSDIQFKELTEWYHDETTMAIVPATRQLSSTGQPALAWGAETQEEIISILPTDLASPSLRQLFRTTSEQPEVVIEDFPSPELTFALLATTPNSTSTEQGEPQHRYLSVKSPLALPMLGS